MNQPPAVSVLLPVFNGIRHLREAVDSILGQTFADFEFVIIDDGSTDGSPAVLREYAQADSRIRLVSRPNKGLTVTLNEGVGMANAPLLARMDADDIALPQRLEKQVTYMREHPDCVLLGSAVTLIDPEGLPIRQMCSERTHEEIDHAHLNRGWPIVHPAVMMQTAAVRQIGGYRDQYDTLEDLDLFLRLAEIGKLANLPDLLLKYRQHFSSVTHRRYEQQMKIRQAIFDETYARRGIAAAPPTTATNSGPRYRYQQHRSWAWAALKAGNVRTARKHALATVRQAPWRGDSWKVLACALRGY
jgi:glycosyltransferase involved in cell wall biosynthesis